MLSKKNFSSFFYIYLYIAAHPPPYYYLLCRSVLCCTRCIRVPGVVYVVVQSIMYVRPACCCLYGRMTEGFLFSIFSIVPRARAAAGGGGRAAPFPNTEIKRSHGFSGQAGVVGGGRFPTAVETEVTTQSFLSP